MAGIKSAACREPLRNICYYDVTYVFLSSLPEIKVQCAN